MRISGTIVEHHQHTRSIIDRTDENILKWIEKPALGLMHFTDMLLKQPNTGSQHSSLAMH